MINTLIDWVIAHLIELFASASVVLLVAVVRIRKAKSHVHGKENTTQMAAGDIKNAQVKGSKNNVIIK